MEIARDIAEENYSWQDSKKQREKSAAPSLTRLYLPVVLLATNPISELIHPMDITPSALKSPHL